MQPQLPGTAESHLLGKPRALPLYPIASTFSSTWSVTTLPTCSRAQVERFASSSAMRMYTSYSGMRSTGGAAAPSGNTLRKCVLAGTPSLNTLMQLLIGIVIRVAPAGVLSLTSDPFQGSDRPGAGHLVVGRLWRGFVEVPPRHAVPGRRLDQRRVPTRARFGAVIAQAALIGVDQDSGPPPGRAGHVRV